MTVRKIKNDLEKSDIFSKYCLGSGERSDRAGLEHNKREKINYTCFIVCTLKSLAQ